ncbi:MAG: hypothetical protein A2145_04850 [candidate division Zixibacteria bacterium RBG_16_40_9]|nr:MAG: hypothetical protein A2145_04850 [candidate division Zixibacteria bacterium RBG_16_40_9]
MLKVEGDFWKRHFDKVLILSLALIIILVNFVVVQKSTFLNLLYLPILLGGYLVGRKQTVYASFLCVALVVFAVINNPQFFPTANNKWLLLSEVVSWGGILILAAYFVGTLAEQKDKKIRELKTAYIGIVEILTKYFLEASDRYTKGHSLRVADYVTRIAINLKLPEAQIENIRVAALLHDIGKVEIGTDLIQKATNLAIEQKQIATTQTPEGSRFLNALGTVLKEAMPLVLRYHKYLVNKRSIDVKERSSLLEVKILEVADSFDSLVAGSTSRKGMEPNQALVELGKEFTNEIDQKILESLKKVVAQKTYIGAKSNIPLKVIDLE